MIPRILTDFSMIIDGRPKHGLVETITLPALERAMDDYEAGGMGGPVSLDMGHAALSLEFTLAQFDSDVLAAWGIWGVASVPVRFLGAAVPDDGSAIEAIEITARGRWKKLEFGEVKKKERNKLKIEMPLAYYRYTSNGTRIHEIDLIQGIEIINGVDRRAEINKALGLTA